MCGGVGGWGGGGGRGVRVAYRVTESEDSEVGQRRPEYLPEMAARRAELARAMVQERPPRPLPNHQDTRKRTCSPSVRPGGRHWGPPRGRLGKRDREPLRAKRSPPKELEAKGEGGLSLPLGQWGGERERDLHAAQAFGKADKNLRSACVQQVQCMPFCGRSPPPFCLVCGQHSTRISQLPLLGYT